MKNLIKIIFIVMLLALARTASADIFYSHIKPDETDHLNIGSSALLWEVIYVNKLGGDLDVNDYAIINFDGTVDIKPGGVPTQYLEISLLPSPDWVILGATGTNASLVLKAVSDITLQPSGDTANYFNIHTTDNIPHFESVGADFHLVSDGGTFDFDDDFITTSGQFAPAVGSAAAPSYSFLGNLDAGMYLTTMIRDRLYLGVDGSAVFSLSSEDVTLTVGLWSQGIWVSSKEIVGADGEVNKNVVEDSDNWDSAYTHVSNNGTDHSYIDQSVVATADVNFASVTINQASDVMPFYVYGFDDVSDYYFALGVDSSGQGNFRSLGAMKFQSLAGYVNFITGDDTSMYFDAGGSFTFRDVDAENAVRATLNSATGNLALTGNLDVDSTGSTLADATIGDGTNDILVSSAGVVTMRGTAKRALTLRAEMDYAAQIASAKPTQVALGIYKGYSFPIWNDGVNADEQMFFRENVPGRWGGASDIIIHLKVALGGAEDVGDKFNLEWAWEHSPAEEPVPITSNSVPVETTVLDGRAAQYDEYLVEFTIDYDIDGVGNEIQMHELLGGRLRRLAASANEVTNEPILLDWHTYYVTDKVFKAP